MIGDPRGPSEELKEIVSVRSMDADGRWQTWTQRTRDQEYNLAGLQKNIRRQRGYKANKF